MEFHPLTPDRWPDFEDLFGPKGSYGGCWCMWWRLSRKEFELQQGEGNRRAMKALVESGQVPGILGYSDGKPVGWCSVAPRAQYASLNRSRILKRIDDTPVWSIVCFFVSKTHRGHRTIEKLIQAAIDYVRTHGGNVVEAYPTVPKSSRVPPVSSYMGFPSTFERAGFIECGKPSQSKRIMRYYIDQETALEGS
jgi:GNAT superfamily N-acetyltransferase